MRDRAQTSIEYLLLVAGTILIVLVIGYYVISAASELSEEVNKAVHD